MLTIKRSITLRMKKTVKESIVYMNLKHLKLVNIVFISLTVQHAGQTYKHVHFT